MGIRWIRIRIRNTALIIFVSFRSITSWCFVFSDREARVRADVRYGAVHQREAHLLRGLHLLRPHHGPHPRLPRHQRV
jgi:hypothetical protein